MVYLRFNKIILKDYCCFLFFLSALIIIFPVTVIAQDCSSISATYISSESRCTATGSIQVNALGGSGNYMYKATGPVTTNFSITNPITALSPGTYLIMIKDIGNNCIYQQDSVVVTGKYQDFRFLLNTTQVTCVNGSDGSITLNSTEYGRSPFLFSIVAPSASNEGISNTTGIFTGLIPGDYRIQGIDSCGGIQTRTVTINNYNWYINNFTVTRSCDDAYINIWLRDNSGHSSPATVFDSFTYGLVNTAGDTTWSSSSSFSYPLTNKRSLEIVVKDNCGNISSTYWTENKIPSITDTISIADKTCSTFTAIVTGAVNLINPQYCLLNNNNQPISCNNTGNFTAIPYGNYCIKITDECYDTVITKCFLVNKKMPSANETIMITDVACKTFQATVTQPTNLTHPDYCLFNADDVLISCNNTGTFSNVLYGSYSIKITNDIACYDTVITRQFTVTKPEPFLQNENTITPFNNGCNSFSVALAYSNWDNPSFCLYDTNNILLRCNTTGLFSNLPFGNFCIEVKNDTACYDTTMLRCFTGFKAIPAIGDYAFSNTNCSTFTAIPINVQNLSSPQFCLFDSTNNTLGCNTTGSFSNLQLGRYCVNMTNTAACYDTVIQRCFTISTISLPPTEFSMNAAPSCILNKGTDINVNIFSGGAPYSIKVFDPSDHLVASASSNGPTTIYGLEGLPVPLQYKVVVKGLCSRSDSLYITPVSSTFSKSILIKSQCPTGTAGNGVSDLEVTAISDQGHVTVLVVKRDGANFTVAPEYQSGNMNGFHNLVPGTYILRMQPANCNTLFIYDTVIIPAYTYPNLSRSAAYRCDNADVSIGAGVTGGVAPFMYEIFETLPDTPNIISPPQASPLFTFNTTASFSLIRLRVVDACGNASINDLSIQPLGTSIITASTDCFFSTVVLKADTIANAIYHWYRKTSPSDSVLLNTSPAYTIPYLTPADTGWYICKISVNNDCFTRLSYFHLDGYCSALPVTLTLKGQLQPNNMVKLYWDAFNETDIKEYQLERKGDNDNRFSFVGYQVFAAGGSRNNYTLTDASSLTGNSYYRLKITESNGSFTYSNIVHIRNNNTANTTVNIYPNPVQSSMMIEFTNPSRTNYAVEIVTATGQKVYSKVFNNVFSGKLQVFRIPSIKPGLHFVSVTNTATGKKYNFRITYL